MGLQSDLIALLFWWLYSVRDFFLVNVPLVGQPVGLVVQWIINTLPL